MGLWSRMRPRHLPLPKNSLAVGLTCAFVEYVVEGAVGHPVGDDDGVGGRRCLAAPKHRQHVGV